MFEPYHSKEAILQRLRGLTEVLSHNFDDDSLFGKILDYLLRTARAERGCLFLLEGEELRLLSGLGVDGSTIEDARAISRTVVNASLTQDAVILSNDVGRDPRFRNSDSARLNKIRAILCAPLSLPQGVIGAIYLDSRVTSNLFSEGDREFLGSVASIFAALIDKSFAYRKCKAQVLLKRSPVIEVDDSYLVGRSAAMHQVIYEAELAARSDLNLLLLGETGVGKGVLARFVHERSQRRDGKFIPVHCAGVPETLFESELFGHAKGSFTGAVRDKKGLFEEAEQGIIFLDEIANISLPIQAKLLEAAEDRIIRRLGETRTWIIDARLISATNKDLKEEVKQGRFRDDLYFRISPISIEIPPLRDHKEDIPVLVECFLEISQDRAHKMVTGLGPGVMDALLSYSWPGNVRQLRSVVERAVAMAPGKRIFVEDLGLPEPSPPKPLKDQLREYERSRILEALSQTRGNITHAAQILKITPRHLRRLMKHYGIEREETGRT